MEFGICLAESYLDIDHFKPSVVVTEQPRSYIEVGSTFFWLGC